MNPRVLVTGGTGFVGAHCLAQLAQRGEVETHALWQATPPPEAPGVTWHRADLFDAAGVRLLVEQLRPTHLLHLAWDTLPGRYQNGLTNLAWTAASLQLLHAFVEQGGQRLVGAGTCFEYDWSGSVYDELDTPLNPGTLYGRCKVSLAAIVQELGRQTGCSQAWGRIFFPYGPGEKQKRLIPAVILGLLRGTEIKATDGTQVRDFMHVEDVASALVTLLLSPVTGPVNIATGTGHSIREVIEQLQRLIPGEAVIRWGAYPSPTHEPPTLVGQVERLRTEVGWAPRFTLESGLADAMRWWREQEIPET